MPLKDKVLLANMDQGNLVDLHLTLRVWIRNNLGLWAGNESLKNECNKYHGKSFIYIDEDEASMIIFYELWKQIKETHQLRIV